MIEVKSLSKDYKKEGYKSLKSLFVNIFKRHSAVCQTVLKDISFKVKPGEFFGIVGRNGSGKSTLLKLLAGIYQPTSGEVKVEGILVPLIELGVGFHPELTGKDNLYLGGALLGFSRNQLDQIYDQVVDFAELGADMDKKLKNYSSGMQVRLAFSLATRVEGDILLVDEVLAVGDEAFQAKCLDHFTSLKKQGKTVVFVSHNMESIVEYCDRAILLENQRIVSQGDPAKVARAYHKLFR